MPPDMTSYVVCDDMFSTFYLILIILVSEINVIISEENSEKYLKRLHSRSSRSFQVSLMLHHLHVLGSRSIQTSDISNNNMGKRNQNEQKSLKSKISNSFSIQSHIYL